MNFNLSNFNANQVEVSENSYDPMPVGDYSAIITEAEFKPNKAGTGTNLCLVFEILGPTHNGRKIWDYLAVDNPNDVASRIAQEKLAKILKSINKAQISQPYEMCNAPMMIKVGIRPASGGYEASNEIKNYSPLHGQQPQAAPQEAQQSAAHPAYQQQAPQQVQQPAPQPAAGGSAPWAK